MQEKINSMLSNRQHIDSKELFRELLSEDSNLTAEQFKDVISKFKLTYGVNNIVYVSSC